MGEAKRRGTYEERKAAAIKREANKPKEPRNPEFVRVKNAKLTMIQMMGVLAGEKFLYYKRPDIF